MSLKLAMQRAARRAPRQLGESSELVRAFLRSRQNPDGGFQDRAGQSDLYYTVFGLDALDAFAETPNLATLENFLRSFGAGESLDFVHLTCLARCWHALPGKIPDATRKALLKKLRTYRAADGGFAPTSAAPHSTARRVPVQLMKVLGTRLVLSSTVVTFLCSSSAAPRLFTASAA